MILKNSKVFKNILNSIKVATAFYDPESYEIIWANRQFFNWFGKEKDQNICSFFPELDIQELKNHHQNNRCFIFKTLFENSAKKKVPIDVVFRPSSDNKEFFVIEAVDRAKIDKQDTLVKSYTDIIEAKQLDFEKREKAQTQAKNKLKLMLNHADHGYFTLDNSLIIHPELTSSVIEVIGSNPNGQFLGDIFPYSKKAIENLKLSFQLFEEKMLEYPDFEDLTEEKFLLNNRNILLHFKPLLQNKNKYLYLVTIKDITNEVEQKKIQEEEARIQKIVMSVIDEQEAFTRFINEADKIIQSIMMLLEKVFFEKEDINELFRIVHTIKGNSSSFSMNRVADAAETAESMLRNARELGKLEDEEMLDEIRDVVINVLDFFNETRDELKKILGPILADVKSEHYSIPKEHIDHLYELIQNDEKLNQNKKLTKIIRKFHEVSIAQLLKPNIKLLEKLAERFDKKLYPLKILGGDVMIDGNHFMDLFATLVHSFRNSVDHGIEFPEERLELGKNPYGLIKITCVSTMGILQISIEDDGRGINPEIIRSKMIEKNILSPEKTKKLTVEEIIQYIFHPGFSTSNIVTTVSGNGVGMDAIRTATEKIGGDVSVSSNLGEGTKTTIIVPLPM